MGFFNKEKILSVRIVPEEPDVRVRFCCTKDKELVITGKDGIRRTMWEDKLKYPFELEGGAIVIIETSRRSFRVDIPDIYVWNGADIPAICEPFFGAKQEPAFMIPSMVHDYMLEYKFRIFDKYFSVDDDTMADYRRITSLVLRHLFKAYGTKTIKSNIGTFFVDFFQATLNRKQWKAEESK